MPTWKLISDGGNSYRWVISGDIGAQLPEGASFDDAPFVKDDNSCTSLTSVEDLLLQCSTELKENSTDERVPKFQTALGKAISVKESSVLKALSFMAENERLDTCQEQGGRNGFVCSGPFFQTGAGKRVDVSAAGLMRAKKLLGLENESFMNESFCKAGNNTTVGRASNFSEKESEIRATHDFMPPQMQNNFINPTSIKFQTAGGKSVSVSSDALQRARSLLEDLEVETPRDAEEESESFLFTEGKSHTPTIHISDTYVKISSEEAPKGKCFLKRGSSFLPSLMPLQKPINHSQDRKCTNIVIESDNNHNSLSFKNPSRNVPALENEFSGQNIVTRGQSPVKSIAYPPLSDISNIKPGDLRSMNFKPLNGKRMLGGKSSISTFKRPRNCRFSSANTSSFIVNGGGNCSR